MLQIREKGEGRICKKSKEKRDTQKTSFPDQSINPLLHFKSHPKNIPRTLGTNLEENLQVNGLLVLKGSTFTPSRLFQKKSKSTSSLLKRVTRVRKFIGIRVAMIQKLGYRNQPGSPKFCNHPRHFP